MSMHRQFAKCWITIGYKEDGVPALHSSVGRSEDIPAQCDGWGGVGSGLQVEVMLRGDLAD